MATTKRAKKKKKKKYLLSIFGPNLVARNRRNQSRAFSDNGRLSIVRNLQEQSARFHRRACAQIYCMRVEEIKITVRSAAIAPKITVRELVSRARVYRTNARVHTRRAKMARRRERWKRASEQARKKGKEEESDWPRGRSHPEFEVGGRTCNRVSWLRRRIRCSLLFPSCLVTRARTKKGRARWKEKLPDCTRFFARSKSRKIMVEKKILALN